MKLKEWVAHWQEVYDKPAVRPSTYQAHGYLLKNHIVPRLSEMELTDIETQEERFFNALVLAVYDGVPAWHEVRLEYDDGSEFYNLGVLELSGDEKVFPVDGQHRVEGIKKVIRESDKYDNEQIPVIFIGHKTDDAGMQRSRRLFSTLNRYAKPVSMRDIIALDEDDIVAIASRELIDTHPLFSKNRLLDSRTKAIPESNNAAFTTIIAFYECNLEILWILLKDIDTRHKHTSTTHARPSWSEGAYMLWTKLCHHYSLSKKPSLAGLFRQTEIAPFGAIWSL